jgi:uncharacterized membrane protein
MTHQVASAVVTVPLETLQQALRNVENWTSFFCGVKSITKRAHERYVFELEDDARTREVPTVVRHHHRDHCFTWHAVSGPRFEGTLKLTAVDDRRTRVALDLTAHPAGFMACLTDMVAHNRAQAALDILRLQSFASDLGTAVPVTAGRAAD